jgi:hypothetical protein
MPEQNDHDLLIQVNTKLEMMISTQNNFLSQIVGIVDRVGKLEIKDRGDSERLQTISQSVQQSLQNHSRLNEQALMIENLERQIKELKAESKFMDRINGIIAAVAAAIAGVVGYYFGPK